MTSLANCGRSYNATGEAAPIRGLARLITGTGACAAIGGLLAWVTVRSQLAAERIIVPASSRWLPGHNVTGPIGALAEAGAIRANALHATRGKVYSEVEVDDPRAEMVRNASLLRSSLFTSVLAFGVAAGAVFIGLALVLIGSMVARVSRARWAP